MKDKNMLKKMIKPTDIIIYFNIIVFISPLFRIQSLELIVVLIMVSLGLLNLLYLILTMILRYKLYKRMLADILKEAQIEEIAIKEGNDDFIKMKQEMLENRVLAELRQVMPNAMFIQNAYIPKQGNEFSEIDILMIDKTGIFIFEVKNITGRISGDWTNDDHLLVEHPNGKTYSLYNPVKQNSSHFKNLRNVSGLETKMFRNIIVLGDHALFDFKTTPPYARICQIKSLLININKLQQKYPVLIEEHQIEQIYSTFFKFLKRNDDKVNTHIQNVLEVNKR